MANERNIKPGFAPMQPLPPGSRIPTSPPPMGGTNLPGNIGMPDPYRQGGMNPYAKDMITPSPWGMQPQVPQPVWDMIFDQMGFQRPTDGTYQFLTPPPPPGKNPGLTVAQPRPGQPMPQPQPIRPIVDPVYTKMNQMANNPTTAPGVPPTATGMNMGMGPKMGKLGGAKFKWNNQVGGNQYNPYK